MRVGLLFGWILRLKIHRNAHSGHTYPPAKSRILCHPLRHTLSVNHISLSYQPYFGQYFPIFGDNQRKNVFLVVVKHSLLWRKRLAFAAYPSPLDHLVALVTWWPDQPVTWSRKFSRKTRKFQFIHLYINKINKNMSN